MEDIGQVHDQISNVDTSFFLKKYLEKSIIPISVINPKLPPIALVTFRNANLVPSKLDRIHSTQKRNTWKTQSRVRLVN